MFILITFLGCLGCISHLGLNSAYRINEKTILKVFNISDKIFLWLTICITFSNKLERQFHCQTIRNGRTCTHKETERVYTLNKLWKSVLNMQTCYHKAGYSPTLQKKSPVCSTSSAVWWFWYPSHLGHDSQRYLLLSKTQQTSFCYNE